MKKTRTATTCLFATGWWRRCRSRNSTYIRLKLLEHPLTHSADVIDDDEVRAAVRGGDADVSRVVGTVFAAGLTVLSFNRNQMGLEELFMKITQGKVS